MVVINRIVGVYLILAAVAAGCFEVIEPLVWDIKTQGYSPVWLVLDPMSAAGIVLAAVFAWRNKRAADAMPEARAAAQVAASMVFYGLVFAGLLWFRSWFSDLTDRAVSDVSLDAVWGIAYNVYIPLAVTTGVTLLRQGSGRGS